MRGRVERRHDEPASYVPANHVPSPEPIHRGHAYALYSGDDPESVSNSASWTADLRDTINKGFLLIWQRFSAPRRIKGDRHAPRLGARPSGEWLEVDARVPRYDHDIVVASFDDSSVRAEVLDRVVDRIPRPAIICTIEVAHASGLFERLTAERGYLRTALFTGDTAAEERRGIVRGWSGVKAFHPPPANSKQIPELCPAISRPVRTAPSG